MRYLGIMLFFVLLFFHTEAQSWLTSPNFPEELGLVNWSRSYDEAIATSKLNGKPVFILFQEVPGCATCKNYGNGLLTHPHVVEAIETNYTPLAIYNNKGGADGEILRKFNEPSWNNPVVRIIDAKTEKDVVKRLSGRYDMVSLVSMISNGIIESGNLIPEFLDLLYREVSGSDMRETHLSMYCFWSREKNLGGLDGVVATKAGYMNGTEVVKVRYDANKLSESELIEFAAGNNCADAVYTNDQREVKAAKKHKVKTRGEGKFKKDKEPKYYTYNSDYKFLPMTSLQALRVNIALSQRQSPDQYLSPRQLEFMELIRGKKIDRKNVIDQNFALSWNNQIKKSQKSD